ncbi:MAG: M56 family metallopeptidase [Bacteroidales bacterium]|nr:M56 family metallopeptidase [Bacteroidales bacterium]MCM1146496.1 M56 family metallopeptidase [Bacteroidales bacterium]MCM1205066.1 M56 family metallopeptidase [Bacillota bacterium]MCM1509312.1 M56 family metallopeptidase [Clostridium sp.]
MGEFLVYSLKVSVCLVMFYIFYKLLLSRTTLHTFNRFTLLTIVAASLLLPFLHVTVWQEAQPMAVGTVAIDRLMVAVMPAEEETFSINAIHLLIMAYIAGVVWFTAMILVSYTGIYCMMHKAVETVTTNDGTKIHILNDDTPPFSWFGNIIISRSDYASNRSAIITHEMAHVGKMHSADIILCNLLTVVQWFNPAAWLLKAELQDVHEYEADEAVLNSGINATAYQMLLVRKAVGDRLFAIANNLSKDSLKKRITMMKTKKTNKWECVKASVALPLAAVAVVAFANPKVEKMEESIVTNSEALMQAAGQQILGAPRETAVAAAAQDAVKAEAPEVQVQDDDKTYDVVEEMPSFPGGVKAMMDYLSANVKYPEEKGKDSPLVVVDGKTISETEYLSINNINPEDIKEITVLKDKTAMDKYGDDAKNGVIVITMKKSQ